MNIVNHSRRPPRLLYYIVANSGVKRSALDPCDAASLDFGTWEDEMRSTRQWRNAAARRMIKRKKRLSRLHHAKSKQNVCERPASGFFLFLHYCAHCAISCFYIRGCVPLKRTGKRLNLFERRPLALMAALRVYYADLVR
jgi:hypothetical protein